MVSELAGEGAVPPQLPTPASHAKLHVCLRRSIRRGSLLSRQYVNPPLDSKLDFFVDVGNNLAYATDEVIRNMSAVLFKSIQSSVSDDSWSRSMKNTSKVLVNVQFAGVNHSLWSRSANCSSTALVNRTSRSRFVKILSKVLISFPFAVFNRSRSVNSSRVLDRVDAMFAVFDRDSWRRSNEGLSAELVIAISSPQRRTRKKKQLLTQIRDSGSRSVEFVNQPGVACVNRSCRGEQPVLDLDFACVDCNRVSAEQQIETEPIKEEPENPPGKSTKSKKVKAVLSQYAIQKFVEEKQNTLKNAKKNLNSKFAEFVEGAALHESPKDAADFSLIPEAVDDYQFGDSNEKFVFPFLPSSDKGGLSDLSFVSSGIASDIYSADISSTYQCQNSEAKISIETEVAIKHLRPSDSSSTTNSSSNYEITEPSDIENWLTEFPDHLDVLLAVRGVDEALSSFDEGECIVSEAKENKTLSPALLLMLQILADQSADEQKGPYFPMHFSSPGCLTELKEEKLRVEDALNATKAAIEEGIDCWRWMHSKLKDLEYYPPEAENYVLCFNALGSPGLGFSEGEEYDPPVNYKILLRWPTGKAFNPAVQYMVFGEKQFSFFFMLS
nr:exocyst complex component EXO84B-like [Ipomoea batatas]